MRGGSFPMRPVARCAKLFLSFVQNAVRGTTFAIRRPSQRMKYSCSSQLSKIFFFFKQKTAYEIGLGIPAEPLFRSATRRTLFHVLVGCGLLMLKVSRLKLPVIWLLVSMWLNTLTKSQIWTLLLKV